MKPGERAVIDLKGVCVEGHGTRILDNLDLSVKGGDRLSIVGPNGAGKSTLLKAMTGLVQPSSGEIMVLNHRVSAHQKTSDLRSLRASVAQIFQGLHLVSRRTVWDNVLIGRLGHHASPKTWLFRFPARDQDLAREALRAVGMEHKRDERVDRLSGGERQKVAIARALAQDAPLLLADEPTSHLDPDAAIEIAKLLRQVADDNQKTLVTVVHSLDLLPYLANRIIGIKAGRIVLSQGGPNIEEGDLALLYG
ncbi:phosphonate ABC transporter ATP-binding protein [Oligoflexus tunisiensis]|uniref:phosphonate ABC transporter ATP-binding protein n=1 Tax=Oligoflexus tunisiensis TaxID=708132 RepID=UPI00159F05AA|nr:ATP-binding cassette domain-containing protein [Oligoflexus tunisiensis]